MATWTVDRSKILQPDEIRLVLADLARKGRRSLNTRMNRVIFRLACCAGLRASEIAGLTLADVQVDSTRPQIRARKEITKGHKPRKVPLTWDAGTLNDLRDWKRFRREQGAGDDARFVCSQHKDSLGNPLDRRNLRMRFKACCKCLGPSDGLMTIHDGRHTFVSHSLHGGRDVAAVRSLLDMAPSRSRHSMHIWSRIAAKSATSSTSVSDCWPPNGIHATGRGCHTFTLPAARHRRP